MNSFGPCGSLCARNEICPQRYCPYIAKPAARARIRKVAPGPLADNVPISGQKHLRVRFLRILSRPKGNIHVSKVRAWGTVPQKHVEVCVSGALIRWTYQEFRSAENIR